MGVLWKIPDTDLSASPRPDNVGLEMENNIGNRDCIINEKDCIVNAVKSRDVDRLKDVVRLNLTTN